MKQLKQSDSKELIAELYSLKNIVFSIFLLIVLIPSLRAQDNTPPTVTLSDTDIDNFLAASDTVTITAAFDEAMTSTPTISISGTSISNQVMTKIIGGSGSGPGSLLGADIDGEALND